jgi:predicted  nucleic acid-binding Zn-ribbon protein
MELKLSGKYEKLTTELWGCKDEEERSKEKLDRLFNITKEVFLLTAIRDIQDELHILEHVLDHQSEALHELLGKKKDSQNNLRSDHTQLCNNCNDEPSRFDPVRVNPGAIDSSVSIISRSEI